jgi:hypothetical protein
MASSQKSSIKLQISPLKSMSSKQNLAEIIKNNQSLISIREQCINERARQETELMADLY